MIALHGLYGIGWTVFLLPNDITTGGVPALHPSYYFATGFPVQYTYFAINFRLLALTCVGMEVQRKDNLCRIHLLTFFLSIIQKLTEVLSSCTTSLSWLVSSVPPSAVAASASPFPTTAVLAARHHCRRNHRHRDITLGRVMLICDLIIISSVTLF